jgi:hypothetical protein
MRTELLPDRSSFDRLATSVCRRGRLLTRASISRGQAEPSLESDLAEAIANAGTCLDGVSSQSMARPAKRILILCMLDGYANSVRPFEVKRFLEQRGHDVRLVNTYSLSRASTETGSLRRKLPALDARRVSLYAVEGAAALLTRRWRFGRRHVSYYVLLADCRLRRWILGSSLNLDDFDLVICETPHDVDVLTIPTSARTLYDCPTPWADELYYEGRLTELQQTKLRSRERDLLEKVDHLAFHWESYGRYAVDHYRISGRNLLTLNWGCTPNSDRATFAKPPRIVYFGSLGSRFINLPLLAQLTRAYPNIDVYGGPPPDDSLKLNYRGYAPPSVLRNYQLGLITCTDDQLRREGFSAKHLRYFEYGLPVLVPAWRRGLDLLRGSVPYDERSFLQVVDALSTQDSWQVVSEEAYRQARRLAWDETLQPLERLLEEHS